MATHPHSENQNALRILISGGGTGGHVFPAIAIADALRERVPGADIRFVGALGKIEMEKVPKAGYPIEGLWISGFQRQLTLRNLLFPFKLLHSMWKARHIVGRFRPHIVIGVGGYASGPVLETACRRGIPTLIQEQNSYAGVTNRLLANRVNRICVAYEGMDRFFPADKTVLTGNPVRAGLANNTAVKVDAAAHFGLKPGLPVVFVFGGSLGALSINEAMAANSDLIAANPEVQVLWQVGKLYLERFSVCATAQLPNVRVVPFVDRMDLAYALADVVVSRAGALTISELCLVGKPAILIPSPNVAEDHQTKNAQALVEKEAALMIPNGEATARIMAESLELLKNEEQRLRLAANIRALARPNAASDIASEVLKLVSAGESGFVVSRSIIAGETINNQQSEIIDQQPVSASLLSISDIKKIYFIGIGGIGMSALARYFRGRGAEVFGYDKTETELTRTLAAEGMTIHYTDDVAAIPPGIDLVVYTPAVPADMKELAHLRASGYPVKKRSEVLGIISRGMKTAAIAGTHGKTTTSSLTTWLLRSSGVDCSAFLGGIVRNFGANFVEGKSDWVVVEADEYDRSFLQLDPDVAVILSMDADHLDIYGDRESMVETGYKAFAAKLKPGGKLFVQHRWAGEFPQALPFGIENGVCRAENVRSEGGYFVFDYVSEGVAFQNLRFTMPGRHNVENAVAAISLALVAGAQEEGIRKGLESFAGIQRRFEIVYRDDRRVYVDDYAHHPSELEAVIGAAREFFPGRKITGVFQPHLYSRTRDFAEGFAQALDSLDEVILLDIYPAREAPIPGVSADTIAGLMRHPRLKRMHKAELLEVLKEQTIDVLLTAGAGDIDTMVEPIRSWLASEN